MVLALPVEEAVSRCLDHRKRDLETGVRRSQEITHHVGLGQGEGAAPCADRQGAVFGIAVHAHVFSALSGQIESI